MTNQTERDAFEKWLKSIVIQLDHLQPISLFEVWQAATAYARQDERAKVIEECADIVDDMLKRWIRNNEIGQAITMDLLIERMTKHIRALQPSTEE